MLHGGWYAQTAARPPDETSARRERQIREVRRIASEERAQKRRRLAAEIRLGGRPGKQPAASRRPYLV